MVEREAATVGLPVVHDEHPKILERALEDAPAAVPGRACRREFIERIRAICGADAVHAAEHVVERTRRRAGDLRGVSNG
jgi:hypothetical protein